jgi:putative component of membrane protein insertase Oxa1/YidC/SpoIIIJ protein YidD
MRGWIYLSILLISISYPGASQGIAKDLLLIKNFNTAPPAAANVTPSFYVKNIQTQIGKTCVYETKCGEFTKGLFKEFGSLKGFFLAVDRVGRCTHISTMETLPNRLNKDGKIIEEPKDYRLHQ